MKVTHSFIILCQTTTLNVAFNSYNRALLTIMMSNNVRIFKIIMIEFFPSKFFKNIQTA